MQVPRRQGRPARTATLELRWQQVAVSPPAVALKKSWPALKLYALWAREVGAPAGTEPLDWLLLTTWPIKALKMAEAQEFGPEFGGLMKKLGQGGQFLSLLLVAIIILMVVKPGSHIFHS